MSLRFLMKHVHEIYDVGDVPFETIKPVLVKITEADQLKHLEDHCPQLKGHTGDLWLKLIEKEFSNSRTLEFPPIPDNPKSWSKVYYNYRRIQDQHIKEAEADLKSLFSSVDASRQEQAKLMVTDRAPVKPGRSRRFGGPPPKPSAMAAIMKQGPQRRDVLRMGRPTIPTKGFGVSKAPKSMLPPARIQRRPTQPAIAAPIATAATLAPPRNSRLIGPLGRRPTHPVRPAPRPGVAPTAVPEKQLERDPPAPATPKTWGSRKMDAEHAAKKEETERVVAGGSTRTTSPNRVERRKDGSPVGSPQAPLARKRKRNTILMPNKRTR
ncbi:hypothetical protein P152DRAFT_461620 [Eremomyces bilateralis CBS 781.70]|uniref:RNA polymerase II transcription factor SIII subunit A n=1 Tax=Eremomyces bilateralis CBS 781.70 TaxID=1392243 RepID=A0A6G1FUK0_9PEZI|nr:uncharacterized protein P152DRAFT_461620 [Eremomyces bilateralis CBS 781.70]KAF1809430.1 hypothetical protein P152DRAFT_461620 [Eremomyces bilateralis CBS 781.70]